MSIRLKLLSFIFCLLFSNCKNTEITGKWKPEIHPSYKQSLESGQSSWGDLILNSDSTFVIEGDTSEPRLNNTVPGWHVGGRIKGNWRLDGNSLTFHMDDIERPYYLSYEIIHLTSTRLVLLSSFEKGDTTKYMVYSRSK